MLSSKLIRMLMSWSVVLLVSVLFFAFDGCIPVTEPPAVKVLPGEGVSLNQVNFTWVGATWLNSDTGQVDVNIAILRASTGMSSGFINIFTSLGWVVQNLPVFSGFPYPSISTNFDLGVTPGVNITSLDAFVEFSTDPVYSFAGGPLATFSVGDTEFNGQGKDAPVLGGPLAPPTPGVVAFIPGGAAQVYLQPNHQNVQTADNQCGPAAVANSLQWLEDTYGINVPHDNVLGLRGAPANSLVGQLDLCMQRGARDRADGDTVADLKFVEGKLTYLANNGLGGKLTVKHQDDAFGSANVSAAGLTSVGNGTPTAAFIISEICEGEDVELGYTLPDGSGHWVEITGAGTFLGIPCITYRSDHEQTARNATGGFITDTEGTDLTDFSFLVDTDGDGLPNLVNQAGCPNADIVVSQSPIEEH